MTQRNGITPVSKHTWLVVANSITEGIIDKANQAPTVGHFVSASSVSDFAFRTTVVVLRERKRTIPEKLQAIAKPPNAVDQMVDCSEEENAGSITNGNDNKASIDPTLDSE